MTHAARASTPAVAGPPGGSVALALGAGGARGVAHIVVLEALDELGVRPCAIAGTSIGAIVGAALLGRLMRPAFPGRNSGPMSPWCCGAGTG